MTDSEARARILIVDDDDSWRRFAVNTLQEAGYEVTVPDSNSTDYDVRRLKSDLKKFDLIIVDEMLENEDSMNILFAIKEAESVGHTISVTSSPKVERAKKQMQMGILDVSPKPYTKTELLAVIKSTLRQVG